MSEKRQPLTVYERPPDKSAAVDERHRRITPIQVVRDIGRDALREAAALAKQYPTPKNPNIVDNRGFVMTGRDISEVRAGVPDARK